MSEFCNKCGTDTSQMHLHKFNHSYGFFSHYDLDKLELCLCDKCLDKLTDRLIETCKINPIKEYEPLDYFKKYKWLLKNGEFIPID